MTDSKTEVINIKNIILNAVLNHKSIFIAIVLLLASYYLQDVIFTRNVADVTSDVPVFVKTIEFQKVFMVLFPYILGMILIYISDKINAAVVPKIELETINVLSEQVIESIKNTKKDVDVNLLMMHIKKITETSGIYKTIVSYIIPTLIVIIALVYNMMKGDTGTGIVVIIMLIALIIITTKLEFDSIEEAYIAEEIDGELYDNIHDILTNIDSVITSDTKDKELKNINDASKKTYDALYKSNKSNNDTTHGLLILLLLTMIGINFMSYNLYTQNIIDTSTLISNILLSTLFMDYYNYCIRSIMTIMRDVGKFYELQTFFSEFSLTSETKNTKTHNLVIKEGDIVMKNINLSYKNKVVYHNFNLHIAGGSKVCIIGPIGSGKSTLIKMLAGTINYDGDIFIDKQNLNECTYESIVKQIAYISQHPKLFDNSILYNLNYGSHYSKEEIVEKLDELGLVPFFDQFPQKLETNVGKEGTKLSGGQRQFVALIRSIIQNKFILLLDEPTSSLDEKSKKLFMDLIKNLKKTIIVTTHDKQIFPIFDEIIDVSKVKNMKT